MPNYQWKYEERTIAKMFGTSRRLMRGTDEVRDIGDDNFPLCLDSKLRKSWSIHKWLTKLEQSAAGIELSDGTSPVPVLTLRKPRKQRRYAILPYAYVRPLLTGYKKNIFVISQVREAEHWLLDRWYDATRKRAPFAIPIVLAKREHHDVYAIMQAFHLSSILRGCGIIGEEANHG